MSNHKTFYNRLSQSHNIYKKLNLNDKMACNVTAKSGLSKGLEDALGTSVKGKLQGECLFFTVLFI